MGYKNTARGIVILLGSAVIAAFAVNYFSPTGISLVGQWDESKGVITANAKDDAVVVDLEIDDVRIAKQIYDSGKAVFIDARSREDYEDGHIKGAVSGIAGFLIWQVQEGMYFPFRIASKGSSFDSWSFVT